MVTLLRSQRFLLPGNFKGWLPPPGRRRRPLIAGYGAPSRELARNALELKFCGPMHISLTFGRR
jgi:hypothetical protein